MTGKSVSGFRTRARGAAPRAVAAMGVVLGLAWPAGAATDGEVQEMQRAIQALITKNQELSERLETLETGRRAPAPRAPVAVVPPAAPVEAPAGRPPSASAGVRLPLTRVPGAPEPSAPPPVQPELQATLPLARRGTLEQRVRDLELGKTAQESAVRSIIQDSFAKTGSKINEFVTLGGAIEMQAGRSSDFSGKYRDIVSLNTAELDLEVRVNDWMLGTLMLSYNSGTNVLFPTTSGVNLGVDRLSVDRATILIGDVQRFPIYLKAGRDVLSFGTSTGVQRLDSLSLENPLTVELFETRANAVGIGFAYPTPVPGPPSVPYVSPPVRPLVINPLVGHLAKYMAFAQAPTRPRAPVPGVAPIDSPSFYGSLYAYDANTIEGANRPFATSLNGRLGYQARGSCGRPYSELTDSYICPWAMDVSVDYLGSVFDSRFMQEGYRTFIPQIGKIPGVAASAKLSLGPILLIGEWNGAIQTAKFIDDAGRAVKMTPSAWQVSVGYQFDWNPWIDSIGARGNYVAAGYSRSMGMAGVTQSIGGAPTRVGFAPESRMTLTAAEWVLDGARLAVEYSHVWDYSVAKGGTGRQADGLFVALTFVW